MRKRTVSLLTDPNNHLPGFLVYGHKVHRGNEILTRLQDAQLLPEDDIEEGLLISNESKTAYPISGFVAILLNDLDVDFNHHESLLSKYRGNCPPEISSVLESTIARLTSARQTEDGAWNREEMRYYDKEVKDEQQRAAMLKAIKEVPIWRIFLPRKKYMLDPIAGEVKNGYLLEIGSGNSRTISWSFQPRVHQYHYIGSDISFKRLLVAKMAVPEGDFFQASALNLPFRENQFKVVLSFGMLHHLPRPEDAIKSSYKLITQNGYFAFHEPIIKPELKFPGINTFRKTMTTYEHSDHDGKIDLPQVTRVLKEFGFVQTGIHYQISIFRSFSETILKNISRSILLSKSIIRVMSAIDEVPLRTIGKLSKTAGASAVFAVFRKTKI